MNGAVVWRAAIAAATTIVLTTPLANMGKVPNKPPISATRMSSGASGPASANHCVTRQRGRL